MRIHSADYLYTVHTHILARYLIPYCLFILFHIDAKGKKNAYSISFLRLCCIAFISQQKILLNN